MDRLTGCEWVRFPRLWAVLGKAMAVATGFDCERGMAWSLVLTMRYLLDSMSVQAMEFGQRRARCISDDDACTIAQHSSLTPKPFQFLVRLDIILACLHHPCLELVGS
jgi:hypothetical protein